MFHQRPMETLGFFALPIENNENVESCDRLLSLTTYNHQDINVSRTLCNIKVGLGMWSRRYGLSEGLPIDVIQMLLSAAAMRHKIIMANPGRDSKIYILIADSLAFEEGANPNKLNIVQNAYIDAINKILRLLKIDKHTEIILSSTLVHKVEFQQLVQELRTHTLFDKEVADGDHFHYMLQQTALTQFFHTHYQVGVKLGWIYKSTRVLLKTFAPASKWDEYFFDYTHRTIFGNVNTLQYLYAKAGIKQTNEGQAEETVPYIGFKKDYRLFLTEPVTRISKIPKMVVTHWTGIANACKAMADVGLFGKELIPESIFHPRNNVATILNFINHLQNAKDIELCFDKCRSSP